LLHRAEAQLLEIELAQIVQLNIFGTVDDFSADILQGTHPVPISNEPVEGQADALHSSAG
jgi:hypothetical protein